jgi:hypothetical protein
MSALALTATIACSGKDRPPTEVVPVGVTIIAITGAPTSSVFVGQTVQLTGTPKNANGEALAGEKITWSSGNTAVARIDAQGLLTAVGTGSTSIIASVIGVSSSITISVTSDTYSWTLDQPAEGGMFTGLWASSSRDIIAVGENRSAAGSNAKSVLRHFDGTAWSRTVVPFRVRDVWGSATEDVWLVGAGIWHWSNGVSLEAVSLPAGESYEAVWGSSKNDVFAVGSSGRIQHFDGIRWSSMSSPTTQKLNGVWGAGPARVFAVGAAGVVLYYDGLTWTRLAVPTTKDLREISGSGPGDIHISAQNDLSVLHFDGTRWSESDVCAAISWGGCVQLSSSTVFAVSPTSVFHATNTAALAVSNGARWNIAPYAGGATYASIASLWGDSPTNVYAGGANELLLHWDGVQWRDILPINDDLLSVWSNSATNAVAVGNAGAIFRFNGTSWRKETSPTSTMSLVSVWGSATDDVYAVGDNLVLHWNRTSWSSRTMPSAAGDGSGSLYVVWGSSARDVFVSGFNGEIFHYDGIEWSRTTTLGFFVRCIWGSGATDVYASGPNQPVWHFDGHAWSVSTQLRSQCFSPRGIWGSGPNDVYVAAGADVLHFDGTQWTSKTLASPVNPIVELGGTGPSDVFALIGQPYATTFQPQSPMILRYDGSQWRTNATASLSALALVNSLSIGSGAAFLVGSAGLKMRGVR